MGVPSPAIPSFTDGSLLHATSLNALASNLTNLYNYNQGGFATQRPCVIARQTSTQTITGSTDTLITFQSAAINVGTMWTASQPTQITIQIAGVYWVFGQIRWPPTSGATLANFYQSNIFANGTSTSNTIAMNQAAATSGGSGPSNQVGTIVNLTAGATLYLDGYAAVTPNATTRTDFGGCFLGAVFLTPSS